MKRFGINFEDFLEFVKTRREVVYLNEGFLKLVKRFWKQENEFLQLWKEKCPDVNNEV